MWGRDDRTQIRDGANNQNQVRGCVWGVGAFVRCPMRGDIDNDNVIESNLVKEER